MNHTKNGTWTKYWGEIANDPLSKSKLYGFETFESKYTDTPFEVASLGACFGFVTEGELELRDAKIQWTVRTGQWFATNAGFKGTLRKNSRVAVIQKSDFTGLYAMGGPIEAEGRLRYIDGCTDTLLCAPPILGDPCLNLLHFPPGTDQTSHTHPSVRMGIVASGRGHYRHSQGTTPLVPGAIFMIEPNAKHSFQTTDSELNVIAYHPDSDWGPEHEDHPMINRTII